MRDVFLEFTKQKTFWLSKVLDCKTLFYSKQCSFLTVLIWVTEIYFSKIFVVCIWGKFLFILVFLIWWNSQSLVVQIVIPSSAGLLLIFSLIACYCCCCRETGSRNEAVIKQPTFIMPTNIPLQNPAENQFKYKPQLDNIV